MYFASDLYGIGANTNTQTNPEMAEVEAYAQQEVQQIAAVSKKDKISIIGALVALAVASWIFGKI